MVDTLQIQPIDYSIRRENRLTVEPSPYNPATGEMHSNHVLWTDEAGAVEGKKAYLNTPKYQLTLTPKGNAPEPLMFVKLSVPLFMGADNLHSVSREETEAVLKGLEADLREQGICCNLLQSRVNRLDTFRNIHTDEYFPSYSPVFDVMRAKRTQTRDYGTTRTWMNTQQEFTAYDKVKELEMKGADTSGLDKIMRFEYRVKKARKIRDVYGFEHTSDIIREYGLMMEIYRKAMAENLFRVDIEGHSIQTGESIRDELLYFQASGGKHWLGNYFKARGVHGIVREIGADSFRRILSDVISQGMEEDTLRKKLYRVEQSMHEALADLTASGTDQDSFKPMFELYSELKRKVLE